MIMMADRHVSGSQFGREVNQMRSLLRTRKGPWTLSEITRKTRSLKPRDRMDILNTLVMSGDVIQTEITGASGRKSTAFVIND